MGVEYLPQISKQEVVEIWWIGKLREFILANDKFHKKQNLNQNNLK